MLWLVCWFLQGEKRCGGLPDSSNINRMRMQLVDKVAHVCQGAVGFS